MLDSARRAEVLKRLKETLLTLTPEEQNETFVASDGKAYSRLDMMQEMESGTALGESLLKAAMVLEQFHAELQGK